MSSPIAFLHAALSSLSSCMRVRRPATYERKTAGPLSHDGAVSTVRRLSSTVGGALQLEGAFSRMSSQVTVWPLHAVSTATGLHAEAARTMQAQQ
eukprot:11216883-Alexandrium_andersonii.AAC.1